ncbi:MAG: ankyrin repeat domain-containing protein [Desulfobacterales bacterium]
MPASKKGEIELLNYLLSYGSDVNLESGVRGQTAIMEAARNQKVESVKALLSADPDLDAVDWEGYTVLIFAAVSAQRDIVEVLLTHGADVNVKNKIGSSALMMASGTRIFSENSKKLEQRSSLITL